MELEQGKKVLAEYIKSPILREDVEYQSEFPWETVVVKQSFLELIAPLCSNFPAAQDLSLLASAPIEEFRYAMLNQSFGELPKKSDGPSNSQFDNM